MRVEHAVKFLNIPLPKKVRFTGMWIQKNQELRWQDETYTESGVRVHGSKTLTCIAAGTSA